MLRRLSISLVALVMLAGCASTTDAAPAAKTVTSSSPSASPTPEYATQQQVASVVAKYESDWREVIDGSTDCRLLWVLGDGDTLDSVKGFTCYMKEQTIGTTALLATRDFRGLLIPPDMTDLVDETNSVLGKLSDIDLESECGDGDVPEESDECNSALGLRNTYYSMLETQLDAWGPYL